MPHRWSNDQTMDLDIDACYRAFRTRDTRFDGRLFGGVRTTRIYCRPICPARMPKRENMAFYGTAAAAHEAGFRPCLRCRPETAPDLAGWRGTSNTVSRALALIDAGALDEAGVDCLAERLGVGERQLRRLFRQHLGASPVSVAQTKRVLLATQLIHETHLSMAEVALASGFGSIRRFNEVFRRLFGRPPGALRRVTVAPLPSALPGEVIILLRYRPPYDWPAMVSFLKARAIRGIEVVSSNRYARTIEIDGVHGVLAVEPAPGDALRVAIRFPQLSALPTIIARVRRVFDLAADPHAINDQLGEDPMLAPLVAARPGLRVPGAWDGFELAVRAVLGQQITVAAAVGLATRLVARYGLPLRDAGLASEGLTHIFPRPEHLASMDPTALGMPRMRAATLQSLAAAVAADPQVLGAGRSLSECVTQLRALPGIGEWTAQYIAMRELREPDAFPAGDIGLVRAVSDAEGARPTSRELIARAEGWRPWRAYAAQHLWASSSRPQRRHAVGQAVGE
jgi:AraC family transcriptional regulator of adaptative response / DNA-3-methyladenine glycosylase II